MTQATSAPHILVAVDLSLTRRVYEGIGTSPIILAENPLLLSRPAPTQTPFLRRPAWVKDEDVFPLLLDAHVLEGYERLEGVYAIREAMARARERFRLPAEAPVVATVVGNEASLRVALGLREANFLLPFNHFLLNEIVRNGRAASFLGAVLADIQGLELRYLTEAVGGLAAPRAVDAAYRHVVDLARNHVGGLMPVTKARGNRRFLLGVRATPQIYVMTNGEWSRLPLDDGPMEEPGTSVTTHAIDAFRAARRQGGSGLRGILVNVFASDPSRHSAADPPYVTWGERKAATDAGLEVILLDAEAGVLCPAPSGEEKGAKLIRVCGV